MGEEGLPNDKFILYTITFVYKYIKLLFPRPKSFCADLTQDNIIAVVFLL